VAFLEGFREYLRGSQAKYGELVRAEKKLGDEAEGILKAAIVDYKKTFMAMA
jgi:F-type H+-transporting ATPase subunit alpha